MLLVGNKYVNFDNAPHLGELKWNKQGTKPLLTLKDGTQYELKLLGASLDDYKNLTLGDWKKIAEETDRMLCAKGILDAAHDQSHNSSFLDKVEINAKGVKWNGGVIRHSDKQDTKDSYKELKKFTKGIIKKAPLIQHPAPAPAPQGPAAGQLPAPPQAPGAGGPGAPAPARGALEALRRDRAIDEDAREAYATAITQKATDTILAYQDHNTGAIADYEAAANELTKDETADNIYNDAGHNLQNQDYAKGKIKAALAEKAGEVIINAVKDGAEIEIKKGAWKDTRRDDVIDRVYDNSIKDAFNVDNMDLESNLLKQHLRPQLTEEKLKGLIRSRLQELLAKEAAQPQSEFQKAWKTTKNVAGKALNAGKIVADFFGLGV
jgi:hypothetical protein